METLPPTHGSLEWTQQSASLGSNRRERMGWDSNPRYPCGHAGFQDRCLKPLGHPSKLWTKTKFLSAPPSAYSPLVPKSLPNTLECPIAADPGDLKAGVYLRRGFLLHRRSRTHGCRGRGDADHR